MTKQFKDKNRKKRFSDYDDLDYQQFGSRKSNRNSFRNNFEDYENKDTEYIRIKDVSRIKNRKQNRKSSKRDQNRYDIW